jgi:hypothetical protein
MKCRILMLHKDTNPGKVARLEALHSEYVAYTRICVQTMLDAHRLNLARSEKQAFFPRASNLTSQIEKNARDHAIDIVSTWAKGVYVRKIKPTITNLRREGDLRDEDAKALYTIGAKLVSQPWNFITQEHLDAYWALLTEYGGNPPCVKDNLPMRLSEMTARLEDPNEAATADFWLRVSSLESRQSIWLPLVGNPYVRQADQVSKGIQARKTKTGRWRFEAVQKVNWEVPGAPEDAPRLGVDVGLSVLAAASDGILYGERVKPKFDRLYQRIKTLRANRQRQGLKENSPRLDRLESRLSGIIKTETGRVVNTLIARHPDTVFVVEDLALRGCRGQKRFAYRALQTNLERKAPVEKVNPAYTSQECPSCGYVHRGNRSGTRFVCRCCGRRAHADWVGASGILRRSGDKDVARGDHPRDVKRKLVERFNLRWIGLLGSGWCRLPPNSPSPLGRRLTTGGLGFGLDTGTASNSMPAQSSSRF